MKFFFAHAVSAHDHSGSSVTMVKEVLRDLMEEENAALPLSDAQLVAKLGERGITVARRTVAKYREELGRPPASARRRQPPGTPVAPALPEPAEGAA